MNVQIKVTGTTPEQKDETADLIVYAVNGDIFSQTAMTVGQGQGAIVANVVIPPGGYLSLSNFASAPVYDAGQRASVPGGD